jgi:WhiB family redox-sensing transcriptional regulator
MESIWAADGPQWQDRALCAGKDPDQFSPVVETPEGLEKVRSLFCDRCPVRDKCLNSAIIHNDFGYWGGTTSVQRRAMRKTRSRSKCPVCSSANLVRVPHESGAGEPVWYEVCVNCAASWKADQRPTARQKTAEQSLRRSPAASTVETIPLTEAAASCL